MCYCIWCSALVVVVWSWVVRCVHCVKVTVRTVTFTQCTQLTTQLHTTTASTTRTPYAVTHGLVLLMMGIIMPETCWDRSLIINIGLVASCWFLSLCPIFILFTVKISSPLTTMVGLDRAGLWLGLPSHRTWQQCTSSYAATLEPW